MSSSNSDFKQPQPSPTSRQQSINMAQPCLDLPPERLSAEVLVKMFDGPRVTIIVGEEKKVHKLPKLLLCHFSPYFNSCFNMRSKKLSEKELELPDDKPEDFWMLIEFMLRGAVSDKFLMRKAGDDENVLKATVSECMDFLEYADKYSMTYAAEILITEPLKAALPLLKNLGVTGITDTYVELVYRATRHDSALRRLVVENIVSSLGATTLEFAKQEEQIPAFALEMLNQIRELFRRNQINPGKGRKGIH
ncbi:hypothetical protein MBM_08289 [Drepanopeziza brunnea f. sp. 'multigermtubi' MB_m1]|uniref:BTB domain-containing protein n=1 Tax=Marssonina brunnea f. sp. multigermtubi (strain MB_m1) TaxID=1072389 RepID=K1WL57_MARBU|nr:uncharacterized protein MBM_08289 [Drepanopeziza brunnea f. sp. 'multigermtubi' MB_m1]EKD13571.1 hypothetical protein MBM_08289 [Drepanopeziza brunnea f. sp. 'multigermtubi' MB_m1]